MVDIRVSLHGISLVDYLIVYHYLSTLLSSVNMKSIHSTIQEQVADFVLC